MRARLFPHLLPLPSLAFALALLGAGQPAAAGSIGLRVEPVAERTDSGLAVGLRVSNTGDDTAYDVRAAIEWGGQTHLHALAPALAPGALVDPLFELPAPAAGAGANLGLVTLRYADSNGRRFSALQDVRLSVTGAPPPFVTGQVGPAVIGGRATLRVRLLPLDGKPAPARICLRLPDEFTCTPAGWREVKLTPGTPTVLDFDVRNATALPASRYAAYVLVERRGAAGATELDALMGDLSVSPPLWQRLLGPRARGAALVLLLTLFVGMQIPRCRAALRALAGPLAGAAPGLERSLVPAVLLLLCAFTLYHIPPWLLFLDTTTVGGDTPAHNYLASQLRAQLFGHGRIVSWAGGWWCGFPLFQYYFTLPYLLMALSSVALPFNVAFKLVSVLGLFTLPAAAWFAARQFRAPRPVPVLVAAAMLPLLFDRAHTMFGVNAYSTLAGMLANSLSFPLMLLAVAAVWRDMDDGRFRVRTSLLVAAVIASHFFTSIMAALLGALLPCLGPRAGWRRAVGVGLREGGLGALLMAWWLVPLLARQEYAVDFGINWSLAFVRDYPPFAWGVAGLAAAGAGLGLWRRDRFVLATTLLLGLALLLLFFGYDHVSPVFVNVRLWPFIVYAALALAAAGVGLALQGRRGQPAAVLAAVVAVFAWGIARPNDVRGWAQWNYEGLERKQPWPAFEPLVRALAGTPGRLANDLHDDNSRLGSSRVFECVPHLTGKPVLEGGIVNSAVGAYYAYYIQGETSRACAGFPTLVRPTTFNFTNATRHLELFNVKHFIARWEETQRALAAAPEWRRLADGGGWELYELTSHEGRYVYVPDTPPAAVSTPTWPADSLEWLYIIAAVQTPYALLRSPAESRAPFPAVLDAADFRSRLTALKGHPPPEPRTDWRRCTAPIVEESVSDTCIRFRTTAIGKPHIVKCTYHPNWRVRGAPAVYMVTPCFMLVYPTSPDVELRYGFQPADRLGHALTVLGLLAAAGCAVAGRRRNSPRTPSP